MAERGENGAGAPRAAGPFRHELVLASAGSGKTYQLSSRLIGLLAAGVPPHEILASTFTRKAAGEILDRVLVRLAEAAASTEGAENLTAALENVLPAGVAAESLDRRAWGELLVETVSRLHRLQVHTLDAFFHRVARIFPLELDLPEHWTVVDESAERRLRERALEETLRDGEEEALKALVRLAGRGDADRSVHGLLLRHLTDLHDLYREIAPHAMDPWGESDAPPSPPGPERVDAAVARLERVELPVTKAGTPRRHWVRNVRAVTATAAVRDWDALLDVTLVSRVVSGDLSFDGAEIGPEIAEPVGVLLGAAAADLGATLRARVIALGRFLPEYDARLRRLQREEGAYGFADLPHALLEGWRDAGGGRDLLDVHYRLDGSIRHVLLDEFQDTSTAQWEALEPLVSEILSGYRGERAAFIVADPKQSIYGWRDGEPRIIDRIRADFRLPTATLARSWRSSPAVLELVNRVFGGVGGNPVLADEGVGEYVRRWAEHFAEHEAQHTERPGHVTVEAGPDPADAATGDGGPSFPGWVAGRVAELIEAAPGASIGILTRKNSSVARLIAELRAIGVEASEEGGVPLCDSSAVIVVLALLRFVDHPGDRISRYLVATSPLGEVVGVRDWRSLGAAEARAREIRARLISEGYGPVLAGWARELAPLLPPRDRRRLRSLVELAYRWGGSAGLRPAEFVRAAEAARAEDAETSGVRIMTIHRAKGLEFDVVVLPELHELSLAVGGVPSFLGERDADGAGPVRRIVPGVKRAWEPLFPQFRMAAEQYREKALRDSLSAAYVALTRARHTVHVFVRPGESRARNAERMLLEALRPGEAPAPGEVVWETGDPAWWEGKDRADTGAAEPEGDAARRGVDDDRPVPSGGTHPDVPAGPLVDAPAHASAGARVRPPADAPAGPRSAGSPRKPIELRGSPRRRILPVRTPSGLEGGERVSLESLLRRPPRSAMDRGILVHRWLQEIEWLDEAGPDRDRLLRVARGAASTDEDVDALLDRFLDEIRAPEIRRLLDRQAFPPGTRAERELPVLARDGDGIVQGVADRVVRWPDGARLLVVDWKTDDLPPGDEAALAERARFYHPQLEGYCRALARAERIPVERVAGALAFLRVGRVWRG